MLQRSELHCRLLLASVLVLLLLQLFGCSGLLTLASYLGAASTIQSFFESDASYGLGGYVFLDPDANLIAIANSGTPPSGGAYQVYPDALISLDTIPVKTTTTDATGKFHFSHIPATPTHVVLSVTTPEGNHVYFNVELDLQTIEPFAP